MLEVARLVTEPAGCPYLPDRIARTDLRLVADITPAEYSAHLAAGFRRFGCIIFQPACETCRACTPLRVPVAKFVPSRSQRRVLRANRDVRVEAGEPRLDDERLEVYRAFHRERSERVGWALRNADPEEYERTFLANPVPTIELCYRIEGRLAAVAYIDESSDAINSIYCFYHPDFRKRSLGTFDVLVEIDFARNTGRKYLYLGYHVEGCRSLSYKAQFRPAEALLGGEWRELESGR